MTDRYLVTISPVLDFESGGKAVLSAETWNLTGDQRRQLGVYLSDLTDSGLTDSGHEERNPARYRALKEHLERQGVNSPEWVAMHALFALGFMTENGADTPEALYHYRVDDVRQRREHADPREGGWIHTDERIGIRATHPSAAAKEDLVTGEVETKTGDEPWQKKEVQGWTPAELECFSTLLRFWKLWHALPRAHPNEMTEMLVHYHAIQAEMMCRIAIRQNPDYFTHTEEFE